MIVSKSLKYFFLLLVSALIILLDYSSKLWAQKTFFFEPQSFPMVFIANFFGIHGQITYTVNSGAAWGLFAEFPNILVFFRIALICCLVVYLIRFNGRKTWELPLVCIISGAIGNVIDFFVYGYVIDMVQLTFWGYNYPVFNIADSSIFIGALWIMFLAYFEKQQAKT